MAASSIPPATASWRISPALWTFAGSGVGGRAARRPGGRRLVAAVGLAPRTQRAIGYRGDSGPPDATAVLRAAVVDRRAAVHQSQQRPRAGIFRRRDHRGF